MEVFSADVEHWPALEALCEEFLEGPLKKRFDLNKEGLKRYFKLSQVDPRYVILCAREEENGRLLGMALLYEILVSDIYSGLNPQSFIHVLYLNPKASKGLSKLLIEAMEEWGRSRNHSHIIGNVRAGRRSPFKVRAAEKRYGYKPLYLTMGKPLWAKEGG